MKQRENKNYPTKKKNNTVKGNMIIQTRDVAGLICIKKNRWHTKLRILVCHFHVKLMQSSMKMENSLLQGNTKLIM